MGADMQGTGHRRSALLLACVVIGAGGCNAILGIQDHQVAEDAGGSDATSSSSSGSSSGSGSGSGSGSSSGSSSGSGSGSGSSSGGSDSGVKDAGTDADAAGVCAAGDLRCAGTQPQACQGGQWVNMGTPCGGATPLCSNGVCSSYRNTGGIRSTAPSVGDGGIPDGGYSVLSGGFEFPAPACDAGMCAPRACNANGLCVTGGIVP